MEITKAGLSKSEFIFLQTLSPSTVGSMKASFLRLPNNTEVSAV